MRLWLLDLKNDDFDYDQADAFVVRAETEEAARSLAAQQSGCEGAETWTDGDKSRCVVLLPEGDPGVIVRSFNAG